MLSSQPMTETLCHCRQVITHWLNFYSAVTSQQWKRKAERCFVIVKLFKNEWTNPFIRSFTNTTEKQWERGHFFNTRRASFIQFLKLLRFLFKGILLLKRDAHNLICVNENVKSQMVGSEMLGARISTREEFI